jgi:hypothetical protein
LISGMTRNTMARAVLVVESMSRAGTGESGSDNFLCAALVGGRKCRTTIYHYPTAFILG